MSTSDHEDGAYEYAVWNGTLPTATTPIAKECAKATIAEQEQATADILNFLLNPSRDLALLNSDTSKVPFLTIIPGTTNKVRVLHAIGTGKGCNGINPSSIDENIMALHGDICEPMAMPAVLKLPTNAFEFTNTKVIEEKDFLHKIATATTTSRTTTRWAKAADLDKSTELPALVPVPAYLVYDFFDEDADPLLLFERIHSRKHIDDCQCIDALTLIRAFLSTTQVKYTKHEGTHILNADVYLTTPNADARKWRKLRFLQVYNSIASTTTSAPPALPPPTPPATTTTPTIVWGPEEIRRLIEAARSGAPTPSAAPTPTPTIEATDHFMGYGEVPFNRLMTLCGLAPGQEDELPSLWKDINAKGLSSVDKNTIVRENFDKRVLYKEAKIPPLATIITMVAKRNFVGDLSSSSLNSAVKGLSPFCVPALTETQIDEFMESPSHLSKWLQSQVSKANIGDDDINKCFNKTGVEALKGNEDLQRLDLSGKSISDEDAKEIANALKEHRSLKVLDLDFNKISDVGARDIAEALKFNESLQKLYLKDNNISDNCKQKIADAVEGKNIEIDW